MTNEDDRKTAAEVRGDCERADPNAMSGEYALHRYRQARELAGGEDPLECVKRIADLTGYDPEMCTPDEPFYLSEHVAYSDHLAATLRSERERRERADMAFGKGERSVILQGLRKLTFGYARELADRIEATKCKTCGGDGFAKYIGGDDDGDACSACDGTGFQDLAPVPEPRTEEWEWRARWTINDVRGYIYSPWFPLEEDATDWVCPMSGKLAWLERRPVGEPKMVDNHG